MQDHMVPFTLNGKKMVKNMITGKVMEVADIQLPSFDEMADIGQMNRRRAIFEGIESTLIKVGSAKMSVQAIRTHLDHYKHIEGPFSDKEYYRKLVDVVFYSGFRAETVGKKLGTIHSHFPDHQSVSKYGENEIAAILADKQMIRNHNKINACVSNAKTMEALIAEHGSFERYVHSFHPLRSEAELMRLKQDLQNRFAGLGGITTYHFLTSIGMPVLKPDRVIQRIFTRLGLVDDRATEEDFVREGLKFAEATGFPIRYIDIVFVGYGQVQTSDIGVERGVCLSSNPTCSICGVTTYCQYFNSSRPAKER